LTSRFSGGPDSPSEAMIRSLEDNAGCSQFRSDNILHL